MSSKQIVLLNKKGFSRVYERESSYSSKKRNSTSKYKYLGTPINDSSGNPIYFDNKPLWFNSKVLNQITIEEYLSTNPSLLNWYMEHQNKFSLNTSKLSALLNREVDSDTVLGNWSKPVASAIVTELPFSSKMALCRDAKNDFFIGHLSSIPQIPITRRYRFFEQDELIKNSILKRNIANKTFPVSSEEEKHIVLNHTDGFIIKTKGTTKKPYIQEYEVFRVVEIPKCRFEHNLSNLKDPEELFISWELSAAILKKVTNFGGQSILFKSEKLLLPLANFLLQFNLFIFKLSSVETRKLIIQNPFVMIANRNKNTVSEHINQTIHPETRSIKEIFSRSNLL